jgi:hypothetical protein
VRHGPTRLDDVYLFAGSDSQYVRRMVKVSGGKRQRDTLG